MFSNVDLRLPSMPPIANAPNLFAPNSYPFNISNNKNLLAKSLTPLAKTSEASGSPPANNNVIEKLFRKTSLDDTTDDNSMNSAKLSKNSDPESGELGKSFAASMDHKVSSNYPNNNSQ